VAEGRPAPSRAAWLGRRLPAVVTVAALGVLALFTVLEVRAESISYQIVGPPQISATARRIPPGACVLSDNASLLLLANRFVSDVKGCAVIDDGLGTDLALSHGLTPATGAGDVPAVARLWNSAFRHAQFVWFTNHSWRRIAWSTSGLAYFQHDFKPILTDADGDILYRRL
jgi:hypothetical protein